MTERLLLTFNAGSSSLKIGIFEIGVDRAHRLGTGKIDFDVSPLTLSCTIGEERIKTSLSGNHDEDFAGVIGETLDSLLSHLPGRLVLAAHRVVHGGAAFQGPVSLDEGVIGRIEQLIPLAPLHQPQSLRVIHALRALRPDLTQTASFDTAFHATQDDIVRRMAIPRALHDEGLKRYGFHGLSYEFIASELKQRFPEIAKGRTIVSHLGSGASLCALRDGTSKDTSMGFSALDGIPMATRPGSIDPGALVYLLREKMNADELEDFLYHRCGLLGVSAISGDTRTLLADTRPEAAEALDLFCLRIAGEVGRLTATLGGIDSFVFTAGIGENQPEIRARIVRRLEWLGLVLDDDANAGNAGVISTAQSRVNILVIPTDEERVLAEEAFSILKRTEI